MTALSAILESYRTVALSEREKGTYFEELIPSYLRNEPVYRDLFGHVWSFSEWARAQGLDQRDVGIDLVAQTRGTNGRIRFSVFEAGCINSRD